MAQRRSKTKTNDQQEPHEAVQPVSEARLEYEQSLYPIVAVGASAGGIEAITELLRHVPRDPGFAVVFILHQEPDRISMLAEVVGRVSNLAVRVIEEGMTIERNVLYVSPPNAAVTIEGGVFDLIDREAAPLPIDLFFTTLAEDSGSAAIGVVLSGAGSDATMGAKAIKAEGGVTFAQDSSAKFESMPRSAIASGSVDFVLAPREIARELTRIARSSYANRGLATRFRRQDLVQVFAILQASHEADFTHYKPATVERRIRRQMAHHRVETIDEYLEILRADPAEVERLYTDILIRVTGFFRDAAVFEALREEIIPGLLAERGADAPVRVWVPGCATGEEVYSLAIMFLEAINQSGSQCPMQIFGTDLNESSIERARAGIYPESIAADVGPERLRRFFTRVEGGYRVTKAVRDCCIFARQNLTKDPPFSKLDLISCRNVMIYLGAVLQRRVMSIFHYALRQDGLLLLGSSETIGNFADLFGVVDRRHKVYRKKTAPNRMTLDFATSMPRERSERHVMNEDLLEPSNVFREADRVLLSRFAPAGVLINDAFQILQFRGRTSAFLEPAPGTATFDLFKMAKEGLLAELRSAIHGARKNDAPLRREGVRVKQENGEPMLVNIEVIPFGGPAKERYFVVLFEHAPAAPDAPKKAARGRGADADQMARIQRELEATREYLQSIIEEQEAMNEELRSANEEIQSSNEELQSTNEELETAKEELQSSNEELTTLNEELENRNDKLGEVNNDLINLLASVDMPIVMLDSGLRIRRFNPRAQRTLNLIPQDVGRSIADLKMTLQLDDLEQLITNVVDDLEVREMEVQDREGRWYSLRIRPYKTMENKIEGAVLVLIDITDLKRVHGK